MPSQRYHVGDRVTVVDSPIECPFTWVKGMNQYMGRETTIANARLCHDGRDWRYEIEADHRYYAWCENCFKETHKIVELPEFEPASVDSMLSLFG